MILTKEDIDNLPNMDEKIIDKYLKTISKEIADNINIVGLQKARQNVNLKYGKYWRERLTIKKIYKIKTTQNDKSNTYYSRW